MVGSSRILLRDLPLGIILFCRVKLELEKERWVDVLSGLCISSYSGYTFYSIGLSSRVIFKEFTTFD